MKIKIAGKSPELFDHYLKSVLNLAAVAAMGGRIPSQRDIEMPDELKQSNVISNTSPSYWFREKDGTTLDCFNLYPMSNDYYANVRDEGENFIVLDFWCRYDMAGGGSFVRALCGLLSVRFYDNVSIIVE